MQGQIDIFNFLDPKDDEKNQEPKQETKVKPICQYSKHTCNKDVLGHESIETTQIYLDISEDNLKNEHMKYC